MDSVAIKFGTIQIYWYSIFIFFGVISATFVILKEMKKKGIPEDFIINLFFNTIILGIIGARIYYVVFNLEYYLSNPLEILQIWNGGLAIHGGIIFGVIAIYFTCKKNKINILQILDIMVIGLILGQAIGRWGNFFNKEAYGPSTSLEHLRSLYIPEFIYRGMKISGEYHHPTFLYESIWNFLGFFILFILKKLRKLKDGQLTGIYLIWYSLARFFIEGLRMDSLMLGSIRIAQVISIIMFLIGIYFLFIRKNKILKK